MSQMQDLDEDGVENLRHLANNRWDCRWVRLPQMPNAEQLDDDDDGIGNACDDFADGDGDGVSDAEDNCPNAPMPIKQTAMGIVLVIYAMTSPRF